MIFLGSGNYLPGQDSADPKLEPIIANSPSSLLLVQSVLIPQLKYMKVSSSILSYRQTLCQSNNQIWFTNPHLSSTSALEWEHTVCRMFVAEFRQNALLQLRFFCSLTVCQSERIKMLVFRSINDIRSRQWKFNIVYYVPCTPLTNNKKPWELKESADNVWILLTFNWSRK